MPAKVKFEKALSRLEEIVENLEQGKGSLDEAIAAFEEGIGLARQCSEKLDEAEKKIKKLIKTDTGFQLDLLEGEDI